MSLFFLFYIVNKMERAQDTVEESAESVNPNDQGPSALGPSEPARGEHGKGHLKHYLRFIKIWQGS